MRLLSLFLLFSLQAICFQLASKSFFVTWKEKNIILDETKMNANVYMTINADPQDLKAMKKELEQYGLKLNKRKRKVEVLVITDTHN